MKPLFVESRCVANVDEAHRAPAAGAGALGLVSVMPGGPGVTDEATIACVAAAVPRAARSFMNTTLTTVGAIVTHLVA